MQDLELKGANLSQAQLVQSETLAAQSRMQDVIRYNMQVTQALLDRASSAAANVQAVLDDTAARLRDSSSFRIASPLGKYFLWALCGLFSSLVGTYSPRSGLAVFSMGAGKSLAGPVVALTALVNTDSTSASRASGALEIKTP